MLKHSLIIITFLVLLGNSAFAQYDSIIIVNKFYGYHYYYEGEKISSKEVLSIFDKHPLAYDKFKSATEAHTFASIFTVVGAGLIIAPIFINIATNSSNWSMAYAGGGVMLVSIPLYLKYAKHVPVAVNMYNSSPKASTSPQVSINFGSTRNGLGLCVNF